MGRSERDKGARAERELAKLIGGARVPLSGAAGGRFSGDVVDAGGRRWEVKIRRNGFKQLYAWLEKADVLAVRADRKPWLVVMMMDQYLALAKGEAPCRAETGMDEKNRDGP